MGDGWFDELRAIASEEGTYDGDAQPSGKEPEQPQQFDEPVKDIATEHPEGT